MSLSECKACGQKMLWTLTPKGNKAVIDYAPAANGNVLVLQPTGLDSLLSVVLSGDTLERARSKNVDLRCDHHVTCPHAEQFRRRN
jgi:hypothetical protein